MLLRGFSWESSSHLSRGIAPIEAPGSTGATSCTSGAYTVCEPRSARSRKTRKARSHILYQYYQYSRSRVPRGPARARAHRPTRSKLERRTRDVRIPTKVQCPGWKALNGGTFCRRKCWRWRCYCPRDFSAGCNAMQCKASFGVLFLNKLTLD